MNMLPMSVMIAFIAIFTVSGCSKADIAPMQQLEFELVVLDKNGEKTNKLKQGEDFFIGFEVSNLSEDTVFVSHRDGDRLFQQFYKQRDFLSIYRKDNGTDHQDSVYIGKPYDPDVEINFPAINLPGYFLRIPPSGQQYIFRASWSDNPINRPLPADNYYSAFKDKIIIEGIEIVIDTSIEFEVN